MKNQLGGLRVDQARHDHHDRLDGRADDRPRLDPAAGRQQDPQPPQEPDPRTAQQPWDPDLKFHAPWQSGLTGIAYNADKTDEVKSFTELLTRSDLKGRITLLTEMRDTMGFMLDRRREPGEVHRDEWQNAIDSLHKAVSDGQVRSFNGNDYLNDLAVREHAGLRGVVRRRDHRPAGQPEPQVRRSGGGPVPLGDNMIVPNLATHQANAEEWINYYYEPEVAAKLANWNWYICPVEGAQEEMLKSPARWPTTR